ncbi:MAG: Ig-like domain-containing protein, partial [Actinobacteria bacterium]|nr:Ig-like domain-containing protein [Actinomycetota bacterium]
ALVGCEDEGSVNPVGPGGANVLASLIALPASVDTMSVATVRAYVVDSNAAPVSGAQVDFATNLGAITPSATTDANGLAQASFTSGTASGTAQVTATLGTAQLSTSITVAAGSGGGGSGGSGVAAGIVLKSVETISIGVSGTGQDQTSELVFEVQDAEGVPIGLAGAVTVTFDFVASPGGGEYLWPTSIQSDEEGLVHTTLNSGTASGVAKVCARVANSSPLIASHVVSVAIHGGPPDPAHFSVVAEKVNIQGRVLYGIEDDVTAFVGDRWGNPVPPGTAVYFSTNRGIIGGSAVTNDVGQATVTLYSAAPEPSCADSGYVYVSASTVDQDDQTITAQTRVLFSGSTVITLLAPLTPSFTVANNGSVTMLFYVGDNCGNPLVSGTSISISLTGPGTLVGSTNVLLADTQSTGATLFAVTLYDADGTDTDPAEASFVSVAVSSPNGEASLIYSGTVD